MFDQYVASLIIPNDLSFTIMIFFLWMVNQ